MAGAILQCTRKQHGSICGRYCEDFLPLRSCMYGLGRRGDKEMKKWLQLWSEGAEEQSAETGTMVREGERWTILATFICRVKAKWRVWGAEVCGYQLNLELGRNRGTGMTCQTTVAWGWVWSLGGIIKHWAEKTYWGVWPGGSCRQKTSTTAGPPELRAQGEPQKTMTGQLLHCCASSSWLLWPGSQNIPQFTHM